MHADLENRLYQKVNIMVKTIINLERPEKLSAAYTIMTKDNKMLYDNSGVPWI
jgi:hypothetical protein